jgi:DNA-binding MurR/RpiR family transcriptional regulator
VKKDFIQFITEKYMVMTDSEKMLADHMVKNFDRVLTLSVHALAAETNTSVATVVRFAQHMGFEGYKEFRVYLAQLGNEHEDFILDFGKNEASAEAQISKMLSSCAECFSLTQRNLEYGVLSDIAKNIHKANRVAFFGTGTSYIVCQDAEMKFKRIGIFADSACEKNSAAAVLLNMKKGDVVFGISHSGNNELIESILKTAQKMGLVTVAVTTFKNSRICDVAEQVLYTQTRESPMHKTAITSRVGQFAMMDSLFMMYFATYYGSCMDNIEKIYEIGDGLNS